MKGREVVGRLLQSCRQKGKVAWTRVGGAMGCLASGFSGFPSLAQLIQTVTEPCCFHLVHPREVGMTLEVLSVKSTGL